MREALRNEYIWMLRKRRAFDFTGGRMKGLWNGIIKNKDGIDGFTAYFILESKGQLLPTKHPNILNTLLRVKASINFNIKGWAQDRAVGYLPKLEFNKIINELQLPKWVIRAVEHQKVKYYP